MSGADRVAVSRHGAIGHVRLCRPEQRNAIDSAMSDALAAAIERLGADRRCVGVLVSAEGPSFCSGADLSEPRLDVDARWTWAESPLARMLAAIAACPVPVVAAVEGWAVGIGLAILGEATHVVAAADARFWLPEVTLGYLPFGVVGSLVGRVAPHTVFDWALSARKFGADEALAAGLVSSIVPSATAEVAAREVLAELEPRGRVVAEDAVAFLRCCGRAAGAADVLEWCGRRMTDLVR